MAKKRKNATDNSITSVEDLTEKDAKLVENLVNFLNDDSDRRFKVLWFLLHDNPGMMSGKKK